MPYYMNQFIYDIASSSYGVTFIEVFVNYVKDLQNSLGERAMLEFKQEKLEEIENNLPKFQFMLGTSDQQRKTDVKLLKKIKNEKKKLDTFLKRNITDKKGAENARKTFEKEMKNINDEQQIEKKKQKEQNYLIYPVQIAFENYNETLNDLEKKGKYKTNIVNLSRSIQKRLFEDLQADKLSSAISPDWIKPYDENGNFIQEKKWEYIPDRNLKMPQEVVPFKNYRGGFKMVVVKKEDFKKYFEDKNFQQVCINKLICEKNSKSKCNSSEAVKKNLNDFLGIFTNDDQDYFSENHCCVWFKFDSSKLQNKTQIELKDISHTDMINSINNYLIFTDFKPNLNLNLQAPTLSNYYDYIESGTGYNPFQPLYPSEQMINLFSEIEDFISDFKSQKVKSLTENINMKISSGEGKNESKDLYVSVDVIKKALRDMMEYIMDTFPADSDQYSKYIDRFKKYMEDTSIFY